MKQGGVNEAEVIYLMIAVSLRVMHSLICGSGGLGSGASSPHRLHSQFVCSLTNNENGTAHKSDVTKLLI